MHVHPIRSYLVFNFEEFQYEITGSKYLDPVSSILVDWNLIYYY